MSIETNSLNFSRNVSNSETNRKLSSAEGKSSAEPVETQALQIEPEKSQSAQKQASISKDVLNESVGKVNEFVQKVQRDLFFEVDKESDLTVIKVRDRETQQVIRQIPSEEFVKIAQNLRELNGKLLETKV